MGKDDAPSEELALYVADTTLAAGLQYGLWVGRSPSTEEQVALSSMSQDKLGHARAFYQVAEEVTEQSKVQLHHDRSVDAFRWNPAWTAALPTWNHLLIAQSVFGYALMLDLGALADDTPLGEPLAKIEQEDVWHTRHADAWLDVLEEDDAAQEAFEDLWPYAVAFFGAEGEQRFPEDLDAGVRERGDDELREALLDEVVPRLSSAGLDVPAERGDDGWRLDPSPTRKLVEELEARSAENAVELVGLLQDPDARELAELA